MPPKLDRPRAKVTALLVDVCELSRDEGGRTDAPVDRLTGRIVDDAPNAYYGPDVDPHKGRCLVTPLRFRQADDNVIQIAQGLIPWDAPIPKHGDMLSVVTSVDQQLVNGPPFVVDDVEGSSFIVVRKLALYRVLPGQPA